MKKNKNGNLAKAKAAKNDEFYTQYEDIEREVSHYAEQLSGKTVYCNCDDWRESNFWRYFVDQFHAFGLKRLVATGYKKDGKGVWAEYNGQETRSGELQGDGDFRSEECEEFLREADVVVTNPPWSRWQEFLVFLVENKKDCLLLGPLTVGGDMGVFPSIKEGRLRPGLHFNKRFRFKVPDSYKGEIGEDGQKYAVVPAACWWTTFQVEPRKSLELKKRFSPEEYPTYDEFSDVVEVKRTFDIPDDYSGKMGVPISFLDFWNPEQFELLSCSGYKNAPCGCGKLCLNRREVFKRFIIRAKGDAS